MKCREDEILNMNERRGEREGEREREEGAMFIDIEGSAC
jgi:hypothetical protein